MRLFNVFIHRLSLQYFNPRTPLQSATAEVSPSSSTILISIHALHYRVRHSVTSTYLQRSTFQSTHSITECDSICLTLMQKCLTFQSTHSITECGMNVPPIIVRRRVFQSTHSITECGFVWNQMLDMQIISIHALHYRVRHAFRGSRQPAT